MARDPQNFTHNNQLSSSAESIIAAVPANTKQVVRKLSFRNTGTTTRTVTVYVVESAGTAATTNELAVKALVGGQEWNCILAQGEILTEGLLLQAKQDAGTDVNVNCSGATIT